MAVFQRLGNKRTSIQWIMTLNIIVLLLAILVSGVMGYWEIQLGKKAVRHEIEQIRKDEEVWTEVEAIGLLSPQIIQILQLTQKLELTIETSHQTEETLVKTLVGLLDPLKKVMENLQSSWPSVLDVEHVEALRTEISRLEQIIEDHISHESTGSDRLNSFRQSSGEAIKKLADSSISLAQSHQGLFKSAQLAARANGELKTEHIATLGKLLIGLEHRFFASIAFISLIIIVLQILFFVLFKKRLRSLTAITSRISQGGNLSERVSWVSTDEIGLLAKSFNRMLERLQHSQEEAYANKTFLDNVIQSLLNALFVVGLDGKIRNVNPALLTLLKVERTEVIHRSIEKIFLNPPDELLSLEKIENSASDILIQGQEHTLVRMDGSQVIVLLSSSIIRDQSGKAEGVVCVAQDISVVKKMEDQQRYLEEQLRQSQKMEAIGTLAGGIAHDFNNILSTMQGFTWLLMADKEKNSEERDYLEEIYQAGERAASLIQQILTFSRVDNQELKPLKLSPLVKEALRFMRSTLPATLKINQNISSNCEPILANPTQIHQIVINLCTNAVHAMKGKKGVLDVGISTVNSSDHQLLQTEYTDTTFIRLAISDTGQGIAQDNRKRIFEPFFTTKEVGEGTGLGLSVVHGIVKGHNGKIFVDSELERGTTFEVFFPALKGDVGPDTEEEWLRPQKGDEHIMIVEDEVSLSRFYDIALSRLGYTVTIAENADEALEIYHMKRNEIDLVLTDQAMPGMTGIQLSHELQELDEELPVIMFTGYKGPKLKREVKNTNIKHLLGKPVNLGMLTYHIREIFDAGGEEAQLVSDSEKFGEQSLTKQTELITAEEILQKDSEFSEIVPIFINERRMELKEIEEAIKEIRYEGIYSIGHKIQGAAEVFGFTTAGEIGQVLKEAAMKNEDQLIQKKVSELKDYLDQLEKDYYS